MEDAVGRAEFEEYKNRIEQEDHRQNGRIKELEESTKQINALTVSIEKLAQSVESMVREQEAQGKRLVSLESRDGEMWRKVVGYVATAIIGIVVGFIFTQVGMQEVKTIKKIDWVRKLTSRKLWTAVASFVSMMIVATGGAENAATQVTALIMAGASVVAYIIGEGLTDASYTGTDDEEEQNYGNNCRKRKN